MKDWRALLAVAATSSVLIGAKPASKDGTIKTAILSLRPADDGALKVIPPAG